MKTKSCKAKARVLQNLVVEKLREEYCTVPEFLSGEDNFNKIDINHSINNS